MKTKQTIFTALILLFQLSAYSQDYRYCDLRVQMLSPETNSVITSPTTIRYSFQIVNQGPDTIFQTDTLTYKTSHSYTTSSEVRKIPIPRIISPMDSVVFYDSIDIDSRAYKMSFTLAFSEVPMVYGPDAGKFKLLNEFSEDRDDNHGMIKLYHAGNLNTQTELYPSQVSMYPNPLSTGQLFISSDDLIESVSMYNHVLQELPLTTENIAAGLLKIQTSQMPTGVYLVKIRTRNAEVISQLIVE